MISELPRESLAERVLSRSAIRELPRESLAERVLSRSAIRGDDCLMTMNWIQPHHEDQPPHSHPFDHIAFVFEGTLEFDVDGEIFVVNAGEVLQIPADVPHTARVIGDTAAFNLDLFAPARADYLYLTEHQTDAFD